MALKFSTLLALTGLWLAAPAALAADPAAAGNPEVVLRTSAGEVRIALAPERAPRTVANFLHLVDSGFYTGLQFHRVVAGFVVQGGGFDADRKPRESGATVVNESVGGLSNARGTIAMARRQDPDSASAQFYFNLADNRYLDAQGDRPGYTVFGRVVAGMEVLDRIAAAEVTDAGGAFAQVPREPVLILEARRAAPAADDGAQRQPQ
ncbi:MAG: peptidylprolyl isomerase [Pseudomonadota bacterium]|jgi:peptidyl-prolyl cis-trans isomerase A (cyclophilin A)